jgi:hypothetical protein
VKKLRERVPRDQYELYISRRKAFARHLAGATTDRLSVHSNQLAVAEVSLFDAPVAHAQEQMQTLIEAAGRRPGARRGGGRLARSHKRVHT